MNLSHLILLVNSLFIYCYATPVIVWKNSIPDSSPVYSSKTLDISSLFSSLFSTSSKNVDNSNFSAVIFMIDRRNDGTDGLNHLLYKGPEEIPKIANKYNHAHSIFTHVTGVKGFFFTAKKIEQVTGSSKRVTIIYLREFKRKLSKSKLNTNTDVFVIRVLNHLSINEIDNAVNAAIDCSNIHIVLLMGLDSLDITSTRKIELNNISLFTIPPDRRYLEDQGNNDIENNGDYYNSSITYYVYMTPNILTGLLFMIFFFFVTYAGILRLNMISGTDVYVKKYYFVGKEA